MRCLTAALLCAALLGVAVPARAALDAGETAWDGSTPPDGIYFHGYEPSFYAGFAPRTQDPTRVHTELGRGNQQRVTVVLGDAELDAYLGDLDARHRVYQELIDTKILTLTTNMEYEKFVRGLDAQEVAAAVSGRERMGPDAYRAKAAEIMAKLNPDRVFRIHMPLARIAEAWHSLLIRTQPTTASARLDAANAVLPGRVNLSEGTAALDAALARVLAAANAGPADSAVFRGELAAFVAAATSGHYRVAGDAVDVLEFTTIYPAGTVDAETTYKGERIPDFGATGIWPLLKREHGKGQLGMVDYLSTNPGYGFIPLLGYQYAGGISYNAFHNAGVRCELGVTPFLPTAWRRAVSERDGKPMQNLWIVGRGPTSHGCTRLPSGHMSEFRQILPSESSVLEGVKNFRNQPWCYDVFDLRGDGRPEVMGVQYYLAYKSSEHTPLRSRVSNRREPFYRWLYGSNITMGPVGSATLKDVPVCRFAGRKAEESATLHDIPLHEAGFVHEAIQFYTIKPVSFESDSGFEFNRELRKIGAGHATDRKALFLKESGH